VYGKIDAFMAELEAIAAAADKREIERRKEEQAAREVCIYAPGWRAVCAVALDSWRLVGE
jgi:hypothetical protein